MKRILGVFVSILAVAAMAAAKETPVTKSEAAAVFGRAQKVIRDVLRLKTDLTAFPGGAGVATRAQILEHFQTILKTVEPRFKVTPPRLKPAASFISLKDPAAKKLAEQLEILGFVDRYGPLATSKDDGLEPRQFGDALGFFLTRLAELTHTPSTKFSPYLMPGGEEMPTGMEKKMPPP